MFGEPNRPKDGDIIGSTCDRCREHFRYTSGKDDFGPKRCKECEEFYQSLDTLSGGINIRDDDVFEDFKQAMEDAGYGVYSDRTTTRLYRKS